MFGRQEFQIFPSGIQDKSPTVRGLTARGFATLREELQVLVAAA
jgi:hypothetical protein